MNAPKTILINGEELLRMKEEGKVPAVMLEELKKNADKLAALEPLSVTYRKLSAPTGNKRDYASTGIYWWPDPEKPSGLPYIRRDGEVNPETNDDNCITSVAKRVKTLALAAFYFGGEEYINAAREQLRVWYLDDDLGMNPHGEYAQGIPGICLGRGIGLIEFRENIDVIDSIEILYSLGGISDRMMDELKGWFRSLTDWMLTSENGIDEDNQHNNHGLWYDAQIAAMALFTGRVNLAKRIARTSYSQRQDKHVKADGSQPFELARTRAMHYSLFNTMGLVTVAILARRVGNERYIEDERITLSYEYIRNAYLHPESFGYKEIHYQSVPGMLATVAAMLDGLYPEKHYLDAIDDEAKKKVLYCFTPFG